VEIWNPLTAECYVLNKTMEQSLRVFYKVNVFRNEEEANPHMKDFDAWTPILEVYQVVGHKNIWFNIGNRNLKEVSWDFEDTSQWNPLFNSEWEMIN